MTTADADEPIAEGLATVTRNEDPADDSSPERPPRVVYLQAPVLLAVLLEEAETGWRVRLGSAERTLPVDPAVDPALLEEAQARGARVLVEQTDEPVIVGVVATQRPLVIDAQGCVDAEVERFMVTAKQEVLLRTPGAYLRAKKRDLEVYGNRVLTRGRELVKTLAAMIELN